MNRTEFASVIREKYMLNESIEEWQRFEAYDALFHTGSKLIQYFGSHEHICISVSGGSDSDCIVHLVCTYFPEFLDKCRFVFVNTGLEYGATKRHLCDLEKRYGIIIDKIRGLSVVTSCKRYGFPILNKVKAHDLDLLLRKQPSGNRLVYEMEGSQFSFTERERELARYIEANQIKVSSMCCDVSKKKPLKQYQKEHDIDLAVTGERKAEGGARATQNKSCFRENRECDRYMPLFWWSDETKRIFKKTEGIRYSDCYEVWGMKRTGCVGCPFGKDTAHELQLMQQYEPKLYKAVMSVFGQAYELTDRFKCRKKKCLPDSFRMMLKGETAQAMGKE